jgi:hypothetical protein
LNSLHKNERLINRTLAENKSIAMEDAKTPAPPAIDSISDTIPIPTTASQTNESIMAAMMLALSETVSSAVTTAISNALSAEKMVQKRKRGPRRSQQQAQPSRSRRSRQPQNDKNKKAPVGPVTVMPSSASTTTVGAKTSAATSTSAATTTSVAAIMPSSVVDDSYYTTAQEQKLCKDAAEKPAEKTIEVYPAKDNEEVVFLVDVEMRSPNPHDGPPAAIAWLVGSIGDFRVIETRRYCMAMPKTAVWESQTSKWWRANIKWEPSEIVSPEFAIESLAATAKRLHATKKRVRFCSDAPFKDYFFINYWKCKYLGGNGIEYTNNGTYQPIYSLTDTANGYRLSKNLSPFDLRTRHALIHAVKELGFEHDHDPLHDVIEMYARLCIMCHNTPVKLNGKYRFDIPNLTKCLQMYKK